MLPSHKKNMNSIQVNLDRSDGYSKRITQSIEDIGNWNEFSSSLSIIQKAVNVELTTLLNKSDDDNGLEDEDSTEDDTEENIKRKYLLKVDQISKKFKIA